MSFRLSLPKDWIKPLIVQPCRQPHKQTLIVLHGRGDCGEDFGSALLQFSFTLPLSKSGQIRPFAPQNTSSKSDKLSSILNLRYALPHTRFIFLTAPLRACTMAGGVENRQWFDNISLADPETRQDLQVAGLRETADVVHQLINLEIQDSEPPDQELKIAILGFSQGAAASLISGLLWNGPDSKSTQANKQSLVAVVSMSGWLPFRGILEKRGECKTSQAKMNAQLALLHHALQIDRVCLDNLDDGSSASTDSTICQSLLQTSAMSFLLCHGEDDTHVDVGLSRKAVKCLLGLGVEDVRASEYGNLGHSLNAMEIRDVVGFLRDKFGETDVV